MITETSLFSFELVLALLCKNIKNITKEITENLKYSIINSFMNTAHKTFHVEQY